MRTGVLRGRDHVLLGAMSPQPIFGGPVYFIRNVVYNSVYGPLKIQADPSGILVYQNTYVGEITQITPASNMHFRNNLMNLLEPDGRFWGLCTPWHRDDLNAELKRNAAYALFRRAVTEDLKPVWPERWSRKQLQERLRSIGSVSFARGYRLVPLTEEDVPIRPEWVQFWTEEAPSEFVVLSVDPALSAKANWTSGWWKLR